MMAINLASMKILYIDDDSKYIQQTRSSLEFQGADYNLQVAPNLKESLPLLASDEYDVILCSQRLSDGNGLDLIRQARKMKLPTAIVLIGEQENTQNVVAILKAGATDFVVRQSDYLQRLPSILQHASAQTLLEKQNTALRESEARYRNIFENAAEGIFQSSMDGRFLSVNPAMAGMYGYDSPEDMIASVTNISRQIYANSEAREQFRNELLSRGHIQKFEAENKRKDGAHIWVSTNARVVRDAQGTILYFEGFVTDITDRKLAELNIEASETKYKKLIESLPGVVFLDDFQDERISCYMSPRIQEVLGYTPQEWIDGHKLWENSLHPDDRNWVLAEDRRTNKTGEPFQVEYRMKRKDGRYVWIREDAYLVRDEEGNPDYWHGILLDITAQKEAQEAIRNTEGSYRGLFNSVTQAIYIQDKEGRFLNVNDGAVKMYDYPREFFIGKSPDIISAPGKNDLDLLGKFIERAFAGEPQTFEFWGRRRNGQIFPKTVTLNKGTYFGQDVLIAVAEDITERKQAEAALERQLKELMVLNATSMAATQSNNEDELIERVTRITSSIFNEVCGVLLLDDKGEYLLPHYSNIGPVVDGWEQGFPITRGITGRSVQMARAIRVGNITNDPKYIQVAGGILSELCVPFYVNDSVIGVFDVESSRENAFDEKDERLLNTIAAGLGTAIQKMRLLDSEKIQRRREAAILELIRTAASSLDLNQVLQSILAQLTILIPSDAGTIQLLDGDEIMISAAIGDFTHVMPAQKSFKLGDFPINKAVIEEKRAVWIDDTYADERFIHVDEKKRSRSFLAVPLITGDTAIGIITLDSFLTNQYGEQEAELAFAVANHASIAIENARLFHSEKTRRHQAEIMRLATTALSSSLELEKVYETTFDALAEIIPYDSASIEIIKSNSSEIVAGRGLSIGLIGYKNPLKLKKWGKLGESSQPLIISDVRKDERFIKVEATEYIRSWMGIPLFSRGSLIGFLNLDSKKTGFFTQEHASIAQTFANQAAIAMENARLFQQENRRSQIIEALANIANEIATTREVNPALDKIAERSISLLNASTVAFYLLQEDGETVRIVSAKGRYEEELISHSIKIGVGITGNVIANGKPEIIADVSSDTRHVTVPGTSDEDAAQDTMMSAPLILHGISIGAINAWRLRSNGVFDKSELNFLVNIAHQASISIESVRLFEETMRHAQEATALAKVGQDISSTLKLDQVLERIASYAQSLLNSQTSAVYLLEENHKILNAIAAIGEESEEIKNDPLEVGVGILGNIAMQKFGEIVNDTYHDPRAITIKGTENDPYGHIMGVPVLVKNELTGLLVVWRSGIGFEFQNSDLAFLSSLAQQAGVAIENARLFELESKRRHEAETVMQATTTLANLLDLPSLHESILGWLYKIKTYDSASILELEGEQLRITACKGLPDHQASLGLTFPANNILCEIINMTGSPLIIPDCENDPRFEKWGGAINVRGWMGVPLIARGRVIGYITLDSLTTHSFSQSDAIAVQTFAHQAANALENARLLEIERRRRREAENLRIAATAITSSLNPQEVLETILVSMKQVVPFDKGLMSLMEDEKVRIVAAQGFSNNRTMLNQTFSAKNELLQIIKQTHHPLIIDDVLNDPRYERWAGADMLRGWLGVPLSLHGNIIGFISIGSMRAGAYDQNAADLAQTFALHAATALDNIQLFENLEKTNKDLTQAYDTTLAGWGKALELRDKETHGHTNRVTDLTMELARYMGIPKSDLVHLRRGALLHDIGKMGVPNEILNKEGSLTEEEWVEMRKHPQYAFDLLYPITYLRPSLDIPYSHHEWWDGSGYPQKLKGEEIPLGARIFAVIDVWDALLSDRPYRKAWDNTRVVNYLREQSGIHFDPKVVEIFLQMLETKLIQELNKTQPIKRVED